MSNTTSHNIAVSLTDNYGWVTCSVSDSLDSFFKSFIARYGYIDVLHLLREVRYNGSVLSRVYRIGDTFHGVPFDRVEHDFKSYLEGAVYAA